MLFHTWTFFIFFIVTILGFWVLRPTRFWLHWILLASAVFYGWWHPYYLLLVFYSMALDYLIVGTVFETRSKEGQAPMGLDVLSETVQAVTVPILAIGGVTVSNVKMVGESGAVGFAAIAEFVDAGQQLGKVVKNLRQQFDKGRLSLL